MMKRVISVICLLSVLFALPVYAYKRDVPSRETVTTEEEGGSTAGEPQQEKIKEEDYSYGGGSGHGMVIAGYIFIGLGSAAAIAGSTILTATDKNLTGAIVSASGAALGLTGTMFLIFGSREESYYGLGPSVDPANKSYGLAFSGNF